MQRALTSARGRAREDVLTKELTKHADAWEEFQRVDSYVRAMAIEIGAIEAGARRSAAESWLDWSRARLTTMNPLDDLMVPAEVQLTPEDLAAYLQGWDLTRLRRL